MKKNLLTLIVCVLFSGTVWGQLSADTTVVYFHPGRSDIDLTLRNNQSVLDDFLSRFAAVSKDSMQHLVSFRLDAYASPDGTFTANNRMAENRAKRLMEYIGSRIELPESLVEVHSHGIDWAGLELQVEEHNVPYKDEVLNVLRNTPECIYDDEGRIIDSRKRQLGMIRSGVPYNYMLDNIFPLLRRSCITFSYTVKQAETPKLQQPTEPPVEQPVTEPQQPLETTVSELSTESVMQTDGKREFRPLLAVKTNLLYWAGVMPDFKHYTFVPNLEVEWFFRERWSLSATGNYMKRGYGDGDYYGISSWSVEPRWWFKGNGRFRWFYIGAYGQVGDYDVQNSCMAFDGTAGKLLGVGLSLGVAIPFSDRLGLEVGIRGGYRYAGTEEYIHEAPDSFIERKGTDSHWGVTGIKASLYYRFGKGNQNNRHEKYTL